MVKASGVINLRGEHIFKATTRKFMSFRQSLADMSAVAHYFQNRSVPICHHVDAELLFCLRTRANFTAYLTTPPGTSQIQRLYRLVLDNFVVMEIFA